MDLNLFSTKDTVTPVLQTERAECGLACIAMIANYFGHSTSLLDLRKSFKVTLKGLTALNIVEIAGELEFSCNAGSIKVNKNEKVEIKSMAALNTPCVLHWDESHYVVLENVKGKKINIVDPSKGKTTIEIKELNKHFTGIVIEFMPTKKFVKKNPSPKLKIANLLGNTKGSARAISYIFITSALLQLFALASPVYVQKIVDKVLLTDDQNLLIVLSVGFGLLALITAVTELTRSYILLHIGSTLSINMGFRLFRHLIRLPLEYFERRHLGDIVSRFRALTHVKKLLTTGVVEVVIDGIMMVGTLILMAVYSVKLTFIVLVAASVILSYRLIQFRSLREATELMVTEAANESSNFMESVRAIMPIKAFCKETLRQSVWQKYFMLSLKSEIDVSKLKFHQLVGNTAVFGLENVIVIFIGSSMVIDNSISLGVLLAFISYKINFTSKATNTIDKLLEFKMLRLHLERIADIALSEIDISYDIPLLHDKQLYTSEPTAIEFQDITFKHSFGEPFIIKDASYIFRPGKSTALTGPSGCGKTTLIKIMMGLIKPEKGSVLINDKPINQMPASLYLEGIASVMQGDILLSGTIMQNLSFFEQIPDREKAIRCAKKAKVHDSIMKSAMKYDSLIGDMGSSLSEGEKQRILIARALYQEPKILFLDESTSDLNVELEEQINQEIRQLNITRIIAAHRPQTIASADHVLTFKDGQIEEIR